MEEKKTTKISLSTFLLILALIIIIVMGIFIFRLNNEKNIEIQKTTELQAQVNSSNGSLGDLQEKINTISATVNSSTQNQSKIANNQTSYNYIDIKVFWTNFRNAVLSGNYSEIKQYVKFPLQTRGPLDSDPILNVSEENFEKTFKAFLQQNDGLGEESTEYSWIKNHEMPNMLGGSDYDNAGNYIDLVRIENDNWARFDDMIMEKDSNGYWKLTFIYYSEN